MRTINSQFLDGLRARFKESTEPRSQTPSKTTLKHIALVGATPDPDGNLNTYDLQCLENTIRGLVEAGIPLAEDFEVTPVNMLQEYGGIDILSPEIDPFPIDILITTFISSRREHMPVENYSVRDDGAPEVWSSAAERHGAKVIVTFGNKRQIGKQEFTSPKSPYQFLIPLKETGNIMVHSDYLDSMGEEIEMGLTPP